MNAMPPFARLLRPLGFVPLWLPMALALTPQPASAVDLTTHRAIYDMQMLASRSGGDLADISGKMFIEWLDACDGWTVTQRVTMLFVPREGEPFENDFSFSSWESKDGKQFRYALKTMTNGDITEEVDGRADLNPEGGGTANFVMPDEPPLALPEGTVFPTEHLFMTVDQAIAGKRMLARNVFSGTGPDSLNQVTAFIGREIAPNARPLIGPEEREQAILDLGKLKSWQVDLAYFPIEGDDVEPEFEVHYRIMENGVASHLDLDYGEFAIRAVLQHLELLSPGTC